jgi:hypothetical protein
MTHTIEQTYPHSSVRFLSILFAVVFVKMMIMIWVILHAGIGLGPDEAQYWTWSRQIDWGYYSKPPGIAWDIRLGTLLFGDTELGVRFGSVIIGALLPFGVYWMTCRCQLAPVVSMWAGIVMALTPLGIFASLLAITDDGMILFWILSCGILIKAIETEKTPNYSLLGILIALGALFKWPIYVLWVLVFIFAPFYRQLWSRSLVLGVCISLLGLIPSAVWNLQNSGVTFKHVFYTLHPQHERESLIKTFSQANVGEFLGSQAALLSPLLFILLLISFAYLFYGPKRRSIRFCGFTSFILLLFFIDLSCIQKVQGNWAVFLFPTAIVYLTWACLERMRGGQILLIAGLFLSILFCGIALMIPTLQSKGILAQYPIQYKLNPFKHNLGWDRLAPELQKAGYDPEKDFLFGDKYQMTSLLSFYAEGQKKAYFLNLLGTRKNQFSYWPGLKEEQIGKDGFFVAVENQPPDHPIFQDLKTRLEDQLPTYFKKVEYLGIHPIFSAYEKPVKSIILFKGIGYKGNLPPESDKY